MSRKAAGLDNGDYVGEDDEFVYYENVPEQNWMNIIVTLIVVAAACALVVFA